MNITILQGAFFPVPPINGGAVEKMWYKLGQEFNMLGHSVTHISRKNERLPNRENINGIEYIRTSGFDVPSSLIKLKLLDLVYTIKAIRSIPSDSDIIITHTFWAPLFIKKELKKRVYVNVDRVPRGQMKFYKRVGAIRACSPSIFEAIQNEVPNDMQKLISLVPNPIPFELNKELVKINKESTILFVGRIHQEKGLQTLIEAYKKLPVDIQTQWNLKIIGPYHEKDGGSGEVYRNKLVKLSTGANIRIIDPIYDEHKLARHYASSTIFVYPAQDESGDAAPVAPREAMAYGCVPIVSELGCFDDIISDQTNGLKFNQKSKNQVNLLSSAILKLITDNKLRERLTVESSKITESYSSGIIAKRFIQDFKKLKLKVS